MLDGPVARLLNDDLSFSLAESCSAAGLLHEAVAELIKKAAEVATVDVLSPAEEPPVAG